MRHIAAVTIVTAVLLFTQTSASVQGGENKIPQMVDMTPAIEEPSELHALSAVLMDGDSGRVLYEKDGKTLKLAEENTSAVEKELSLAGYFAIVSSDNMTAREAIELYKSRDASGKLFRSDKSYLGNKSMRGHSDEALSSKVFIQFIALILRSRIYTALKEKSEKC